jgi:hypothetical protein
MNVLRMEISPWFLLAWPDSLRGWQSDAAQARELRTRNVATLTQEFVSHYVANAASCRADSQVVLLSRLVP